MKFVILGIGILCLLLSAYDYISYRDMDEEGEEWERRRRVRRMRSMIAGVAGIVIVGIGVWMSMKKKARYGMTYRPELTQSTIQNLGQMNACRAYKERLPSFIASRDMCYDRNPPNFVDEYIFSYDITNNIGDIEDFVNDHDCNTINEYSGRVVKEAQECIDEGMFRDDLGLTSVPIGGPVRNASEFQIIRGGRKVAMPYMDNGAMASYLKKKNDILKRELRSMRSPRVVISPGIYSERANMRYEGMEDVYDE